MKKLFSLFLILFACTVAMANVRMPKIFGDNMVLQRNKALKIWGWAAPGEKISVKFDLQTKTTKADKLGNWQVMLAPEKAGGPFQLVVKGKNQIGFQNILVGEVWICSGQSNMEMPIEGWGKINNYEKEIADAKYPEIRHFKVPNTISDKLENDLTGGSWEICSPATAGDFSAAAYFFGRELYRQLKIPIGLINTSWGGTQSEAWTSKEAFAQSQEFKNIADAMKPGGMENILKQRTADLTKMIEKVQDVLESHPDTDKWKRLTFDDSKWSSMKLPGLWEGQGLPGLDGIVWFRKVISISDVEAGQSAVLELAMIDDNDETFVNGIKVGATDGYNVQRKYIVPAGILKSGKNVISVKVVDTGGDGGIFGDAVDMKLSVGTNVQSLAGDWKFRVESMQNMQNPLGPNDYPSVLFNAMINPLLPYAIEGAIWYQGESNAGRAFQYRTEFPLMITDWRKHWNQGDFPFYFVQLATYGSDQANSNSGSNWAELREAQTMTLSLPHTGMAVTTDIGNPKDIHPKNKQDVGIRLAALALHDVYDKPGEYTGPVYQSMKVDGNRVELTFTHLGAGWMVKDKYGYITGFEIAGADRKFYPAKATFDGDIIVVHSEKVTAPVAVCYNWADDASEGNLFNRELFPAGPFRTDTWDGITVKNKYSF